MHVVNGNAVDPHVGGPERAPTTDQVIPKITVRARIIAKLAKRFRTWAVRVIALVGDAMASKACDCGR